MSCRRCFLEALLKSSEISCSELPQEAQRRWERHFSSAWQFRFGVRTLA